jgi:hypothetical protein
MLRIPQFLDNRLTDVDKAVSHKHRPRSIPRKHYFSASGTHFCYRLSKAQGLVRQERLCKSRKNHSPLKLGCLHPVACTRSGSVRRKPLNLIIHLTGSRTRYLPTCTIVSEPLGGTDDVSGGRRGILSLIILVIKSTAGRQPPALIESY